MQLIDIVAAKQIVLDKLAAGSTAKDAMKAVGRAYETYRDWRRTDEAFKIAVARIREEIAGGRRATKPVPDFPEFSKRYLKTELPLHLLRAWDVIEGKEPRDLQDSMEYRPGAYGESNVILNFPPNHGKSTTLTMNLVTWLVHRDPSVKIIVLSRSRRLAVDFLLGVKQRLTNPAYREMHAAFAPEGGWKDENLPWREDRIFVRGRDPDAANPTVQALGLGSQIYGSRADYIFLDDIEDLSNYGDYEKHSRWVAQEANSRLGPIGRVFCIGTRVGPVDMYRHLRDEAKTLMDEPAWTYFAQPAILKNASDPDPSTWEVLWPEERPATYLAKQRSNYTDPRHFLLIFQQTDVSDATVFHPVAVEASLNRRRFHGPMYAMQPGHRQRGMEGLYVVAGWDPASSAGRNAMVVMGVDKSTQQRWVVDLWNKKGAVPRESIDKLKEWTERFHINEWRIEKNAVQQFITQLDEIRNFLSSRGVILREHHTNRNKWDAEMGVETMGELFNSCVDWIDNRPVPKPDSTGLIDLPNMRDFPACAELCEQLKTWDPNIKRNVTDLVMALWFAELGARQYLQGMRTSVTHMPNKFVTRRGITQRRLVSVGELVAEGNHVRAA